MGKCSDIDTALFQIIGKRFDNVSRRLDLLEDKLLDDLKEESEAAREIDAKENGGVMLKCGDSECSNNIVDAINDLTMSIENMHHDIFNSIKDIDKALVDIECTLCEGLGVVS